MFLHPPVTSFLLSPNILRTCSYERLFHSHTNQIKFQVLTAASMKFRVFWDVASCSLIEVDRCFGGVYCLHQQGDRPLKLRPTPKTLHGATFQKTLNFEASRAR
jgi:hypothetical protein